MHVLVLSLSDPWAESYGGTQRTAAFLTAFADLGHHVTCVFPSRKSPARAPAGVRSFAVPAEPLGDRQWHPLLRRAKRAVLPVPTRHGRFSPEMFRALRQRGEVDLILVSSMAETTYGRALPRAQLWLDFSDLESEVARREASSRSAASRYAARCQGRYLEGVETKRAAEARFTTAAGWAEAGMLAQRTRREVSWLPTPVSASEERVRAVGEPTDGMVAGFLANFAFRPNRDAFDVLAGCWAPRLHSLRWRVLVAGLHADQLPSVPGVENLGRVSSVDEFYSRVGATVAPIRLGGGMKVKVIESLLFGRPVVASPFAVEGFPPETRQLAKVVDLLSPDLSFLSNGPPSLPACTRKSLAAFEAGSFTRKVAELLEGVEPGRG